MAQAKVQQHNILVADLSADEGRDECARPTSNGDTAARPKPSLTLAYTRPRRNTDVDSKRLQAARAELSQLCRAKTDLKVVRPHTTPCSHQRLRELYAEPAPAIDAETILGSEE